MTAKDKLQCSNEILEENTQCFKERENQKRYNQKVGVKAATELIQNSSNG
uniref:Uncharacterized protein n=1 Tax=Arion vulgaris TaxID=1028688 RepID=A0A0B7B4J0_9EUPU